MAKAEIIGNGAYSFKEAGLLTGNSYRRVRSWFCGDRRGRGLIQSDYGPPESSGGLISFHGLVDALVVGRLRALGLSLQYLRRVHGVLLKEFEVMHPLSSKRLLTDGRRIFVHVADEMGEEQLKELVSRQQAFPQVLLPVLKEIDYDPRSLLARRWNIAAGVAIDPRMQRGKPIIVSAGIPTAVLAAAYEANNRNLKVVASWYGVAPTEVEQAVAFEDQLNRSAA